MTPLRIVRVVDTESIPCSHVNKGSRSGGRDEWYRVEWKKWRGRQIIIGENRGSSRCGEDNSWRVYGPPEIMVGIPDDVVVTVCRHQIQEG